MGDLFLALFELGYFGIRVTGFDRIVFKGYILPLMAARGAMDFCQSKNILNRDYKTWMLKQTAQLIASIDQYAKKHCGQSIIPISTWRTRKEALAHDRQEKEKIREGLIGAWSCLESGLSFRSHYCEKSGYPQLKNYQTRCKHIYLYYDHKDYGFMNIRIQTWFPYPIQICLNGREWLRRSLEKEKVEFMAKGNKFFYVSDYEAAQILLDKQLDVRYAQMLDEFIPIFFPTYRDVIGPHFSYYWTMWQSEWATDLILSAPHDLKKTTDAILRHAHITGTSSRVLKYMDRPFTVSGKPDARMKDNVISRVLDFNDGIRVRHWVGSNSVKVYNEQNVLRIESTINDPSKFKVFRHKQGQDKEEAKSQLPLRKGVMDIPLRAKISQQINDRFSDTLSAFHDDSPVHELIADISHHQMNNGRRFRGLDPLGKDRDILQSLSSPEFRLSGLTNKMLRQKLAGSDFAKGCSDKQLSSKISRLLRMMRAHGIIRKLPKQNKYQLTIKGVKLTTVLVAFLDSSTNELMKLAA